MATQLDFQTHAGRPILVEVTKDGKQYELRVGLVILGVEDAEKVDNGLPVFGISANLAALVNHLPRMNAGRWRERRLT
jgi:hypothetical protein